MVGRFKYVTIKNIIWKLNCRCIADARTKHSYQNITIFVCIYNDK